MGSDLKSVQMAKTESERKRKQAEQQVSELSSRFNDSEQMKSELTDKSTRLQQELEQVRRDDR